MKNLFLTIILLLSFKALSQAHFNETLEGLKERHPTKEVRTGFLSNGSLYAEIDHTFGTFIYYFNKRKKTTYYVVQVPYNEETTTQQKAIYDKEALVVSDSIWRRYVSEDKYIIISLKEDVETGIKCYHYLLP